MLSTLPLTFVTIAEKGSITLAADELSLAKSAVSQNLKRLEEQLSVKLANRTTRKLTLTPAGERYYARCKEVLALSQKASTEMEAFGATPSGPITITAPHAMMAPVVAPALAQVVQKYPLLRPTVIADDQRLDLVAGGIDLSISVGALADSSLKARKVGALRDILCASPDLLRDTPTDGLSGLQMLPYISHIREPRLVEHKLQNRTTRKPLKVFFQPTFHCNTVESLVAFAREGLGVALLPDLAIRKEIESGDLVEVFPDHVLEEKPVYAVHAYENLTPKSVMEVIGAVQEKLLKNRQPS